MRDHHSVHLYVSSAVADMSLGQLSVCVNVPVGAFTQCAEGGFIEVISCSHIVRMVLSMARNVYVLLRGNEVIESCDFHAGPSFILFIYVVCVNSHDPLPPKFFC